MHETTSLALTAPTAPLALPAPPAAGVRFQVKTRLLEHQKTAVAKMLPTRVGALLMDQGTGKSLTLLSVAAQRQGKWDRLFWVTPCSLRTNVRGQIAEHTDIPSEAVCVWTDKVLRKGPDPSALVHVVGVETIGSSDRAAIAFRSLVTGRSFVAMDESTYIKGATAKRTQRLISMSCKARYRMILTGTPLTQGCVDLWAQFAFLSPKILGYGSFWAFARRHLVYDEVKVNGRSIRTDRIIGERHVDELAARIAPYVYQVRKDECLELPDKLHETVWTELTRGQEQAYRQCKEDFLEDLESMEEWDLSPVAIFRLYSRLQGVICGWWTPKGELEPVALPNFRLDAMLGAVGGIPEGEKVVVWGKYRRCVEEICGELSGLHGDKAVCPMHGGMPAGEREASLARWRREGRFLVATQSIASHGLTLVDSCHAVFYADSFKYSERLQAEDRIHRIGQGRRPVYTSIVCAGTLDEKIASALRGKGSVLRSFQRQVGNLRGKGLRKKVVELVRAL